MRDYSYNKLFDFIKSKFSSDDTEDWNTPPDFVFEKAIRRIDQQNKRRRYIWYRRMGITSIIFLVFSSLLYLNLKIDDVDAKIVSQKLESTSYTGTSKVTDKDVFITKEVLVNSESKAESNQGEQILITNRKLSDPIQKNKNLQASAIQGGSVITHLTESYTAKRSQQKIVEVIDPIVSASHESNNVNSVNEKRVDLTSIDLLQSGIEAIPISYDTNIVLKVLPAVLNESDINSVVRPVVVGLRVNSNFSSVSMDNILVDENISLTGYEKYCSGYGASIDVAKALSNKVSVKATGQFQKVKNNSFLQEKSSVDVNNYTVDTNGVGAYETGMTITTPLGNYTSDISFPIDEGTLNAKEFMVNKTATAQSLSYISLDLGLQYTINPESQSAFYVGAGIGANKTISMTNQMETDVYMDDKLMDHLSAKPKGLDDFKSSFWSYYGEAGIVYSLNNSSDLSVFVNQRMSLNSIKESGMTGSQTYLKQINIGLGYNIRF